MASSILRIEAYKTPMTGSSNAASIACDRRRGVLYGNGASNIYTKPRWCLPTEARIVLKADLQLCIW